MLSPYSRAIQSTIGPAGYFVDPTNVAEYMDKAVFLPYLNNEKEHPKFNQNKKRFL